MRLPIHSSKVMEISNERIPERSLEKRSKPECLSSLNNLDDGCIMHIFSFLSPIPDRYNTALVCHRWRYLACHPRLWLRVDHSVKDLSHPGVFHNIESAIAAARFVILYMMYAFLVLEGPQIPDQFVTSRPGDTILIGAGGNHSVSNIQIKKPLCLIGGGELPDETTLVCSRGSDSALEMLSTCKLANLTVKAELGCCLLHRSGRLTIDGCVLQCETNPLDHLSCPIVSTAGSEDNVNDVEEVKETVVEKKGNSVRVLQTRIEGGAKAVLTSGGLVLQRVRVMYSKAYLYFWFDVDYE